MRQGVIARGVLLVVALVLAGCSSTTFVTRQQKLEVMTAEAHWQASVLSSKPFAIAAATSPRRISSKPLTVFIEGDGQAFSANGDAAADPTPENPIALRMALSQGGENLAYLARPCQYVMASQRAVCNPAYWSTHRYAPSVVNSMGNALDILKSDTGARQLILVGYSGGGAIAALLAERRQDVVGLVTVAANLDIAAWTKMKGFAPLDASLDPVDGIDRLSGLRQVHFVGLDDRTVPPAVAESFVGKLPNGASVKIVRKAGFDHACCWVDGWPQLKNDPALTLIDGWPLP